MGEPCQPSKKDRAETRDLASAIVEAVRNDERMPLESHAVEHYLGHTERPVFLRSDVEQLAFQLAQEVALLAEQLAEMRAAKEELADLASRIDVGDGYVDHIAALRKVGA